MIGDTAAAAMSFLANSDAVIVDLRKNGGGSPDGGHPPVQLLLRRADAPEQHLHPRHRHHPRSTGATRSCPARSWSARTCTC